MCVLTMIILTILAVFVGVVVFVICGKERDVYESISKLPWYKLIIKFVYKLLKCHRLGNLYLDKTLVYIADTNTNFSLALSVRNHKITVNGVRIDKKHLAKYKALCNYNPNYGEVPLCYAESLFMKPVIALVTSSKFALSPIGLIHIRQNIKQWIPLQEYMKAKFSLEVSVKQYRKNDRGVEVDIHLQALVGSMCAWEGTMTLLSRAKQDKPLRRPERNYDKKDTYIFDDDFDVPSRCGVDYAKLTGDWNPHHLYTWSAWLLGCKKPIAHGMWTLSRAIAKLQERFEMTLDGRYEVSCAFKRPLFMPGKAAMKFDDGSMISEYSDCNVLVQDKETSIPHLMATIKSL